MRLVRSSIKCLNMTPDPLETIEFAGRTCYKSENEIASGSAATFVRKLLDRGHLAMIEHAWASYRVVCDRSVSHEIVRHRLFSYAQESTRYCNYGGGVTFVIPPWLMGLATGPYDADSVQQATDVRTPVALWLSFLLQSEATYVALLKNGWSPQQARGVLPNALKTEIVVSGNLREWLHFFRLRTAKTAHPQMQEIANLLLADVRDRVPVIFEDLSKGD